MEINVEKFLKSINKVIKKYIDNNGISLETDKDNYWSISSDDSFDLSSEPNELSVGSLIDDYNELIKIIDNQSEVNILDLERISNLFKVLSYEIETSNEKWL